MPYKLRYLGCSPQEIRQGPDRRRGNGRCLGATRSAVGPWRTSDGLRSRPFRARTAACATRSLGLSGPRILLPLVCNPWSPIAAVASSVKR